MPHVFNSLLKISQTSPKFDMNELNNALPLGFGMMASFKEENGSSTKLFYDPIAKGERVLENGAGKVADWEQFKRALGILEEEHMDEKQQRDTLSVLPKEQRGYINEIAQNPNNHIHAMNTNQPVIQHTSIKISASSLTKIKWEQLFSDEGKFLTDNGDIIRLDQIVDLES